MSSIQNNRELLDKKSALQHVQDDEEFLKEIYQIFLNEIPGRIDSFESAFENEDAATLVSVAHSLKGVSMTIGARSCNAAAEQVEMAARAGDISQAKDIYQQLKKILLEIQTMLSGMDLS